LQLRHQTAQLLGYPTHAHYIQETRMAKNPETVRSFLDSLAAKLQPLWKKEREEFLKLKKEDCLKYGYEFNEKLDTWDMGYLCSLYEETKFSVDKTKLKEYFPLDNFLNEVFNIYETLLGFKFIEMPDAQKWHEEVKVYRVINTAGEL
jgi:Zn-dependent oligopeptidase